MQVLDLRWKPGCVLSFVLLSITIHPPDPNGRHLLALTAWIINEFAKSLLIVNKQHKHDSKVAY